MGLIRHGKKEYVFFFHGSLSSRPKKELAFVIGRFPYGKKE